MAKTSGWVIVATSGNTVDGRKIADNWIQDMAELYSQEEYTALIWPEHYRSSWSKFEGKNWGVVEELKAEKKAGKLRLFAKITANKYLVEANADAQKLFTSIEPHPDYKGEGRCYLMGLAVTDSPASTGTTRLKFSIGKTEIEREYSNLEPFIFQDEEDFSSEEKTFFKRFYSIFSKHDDIEKVEPTFNNTDVQMTTEEIKAALAEALQPFSQRIEAIEQKFAAKEPETEAPKTEPEAKPKTFSKEDLANAMKEALQPIADKMNELETKFNELLQETPNQKPSGEGASVNEEEVGGI